jgi:hypothetical protein
MLLGLVARLQLHERLRSSLGATRARTAGATVEDDISEHAYGRLALLADPFGNGFCLLQFNARGYDAIVTP